MIKIYGKYATADVFADIIDDKTKEQIENILNQEISEDSNPKIMADCHKGNAAVIGYTAKMIDKVCPNIVGVDIGCGILVVPLGNINIDLESLDNFIINNIKSGRNINNIEIENNINYRDLKCLKDISDIDYIKRSLGSLGGGNHFIEIDKNNKGELFLLVHSGSRKFGVEVANIYQKKAIKAHKDKNIAIYNEVRTNIINKCIRLHKEKEINARLKNIAICDDITDEYCYLEGALLNDYLNDLKICTKFAKINRYIIASKITNFLGIDINSTAYFESIHNYVDFNDFIIRKGAIRAYKNEKLIIPINMRDGAIIGYGKSNPNYNYSAPHGAGRLLSRIDAKNKLNLTDYVNEMKNIYTSTATIDTIDEAPMCYKPMDSIINNIIDSVEIIEIIKPIYNFKAKE